MATLERCLLSVVVPVYDEAAGLPAFHKSLVTILKKSTKDSFEVLYCNDGSTDSTSELVKEWHKRDSRIKLISLSRNFGKEYALSAGIARASGQATLMIDGDSQHPVESIPIFIEAWKNGARVIVGVRSGTSGRSWVMRLQSRLFHKVFNKLTGQELIAGTTDFRLIDKSVQEVFLTLKESDRITRGLIDWLGFEPVYIPFTMKQRQNGSPRYDTRKRIGLMANSFASLTPKPLYLFGYLGACITIASLIAGLAVFIEQLLLGDPWHWKFTGTAMLGILLLFLAGIILVSQGILSLYIAHVHTQSKQRPLYVVDYQKSAGIDKQLST